MFNQMSGTYKVQFRTLFPGGGTADFQGGLQFLKEKGSPRLQPAKYYVNRLCLLLYKIYNRR